MTRKYAVTFTASGIGKRQQAIDEAKSLRAQVQKLKAKGLTSSRLLSMAEAALDLAKPSWRRQRVVSAGAGR